MGNKVNSFEQKLGKTQQDIKKLAGRREEFRQEVSTTEAQTSAELKEVKEEQKQLEKNQADAMLKLQEDILREVENKLPEPEQVIEEGNQEGEGRQREI